jgi:hypothetical protein
MANMSYCRFQNTLSDLQACNSALGEINGDPREELSKEEGKAFERLIKLCRQMAEDYEEIK